MRKHVATFLLLMLLFAGFGSTRLVSRSLAGSQPTTLVQREKQLGPKPTPHWYWRWLHWRVTRVDVKGQASQRRFRPKQAPRRIPTWAWRRLHFFLSARRPAAGGGATAGRSYGQAISYVQTRPTFAPRRAVEVSNASELQAAIANLQAGDLVQATASFTVSGETIIASRLSAPAVIDLSHHVVKFVYSDGGNYPAVWLKNPQNVRIYGGDLSTSGTGGPCLLDYAGQHVTWWGFIAHDCGGTGFLVQAIGGAVDHDDFQGEITKVGLNLSRDPHAEKGSGLHGANLWDAETSNNFTNNRFALYVHDIAVGACVQFGNDQPASRATGNVLYEKCANETFVSQTQTGGNAVQFWGDTNRLGVDVNYLEADNLQGYALFGGGVYSGQSLSGVTVAYGQASRTNQNPRLAKPGPWDRRGGVVYRTLQPAR